MNSGAGLVAIATKSVFWGVGCTHREIGTIWQQIVSGRSGSYLQVPAYQRDNRLL